VYIHGERLGAVLAATERAACLRAIQRFKISREDQRELQVRPPLRFPILTLPCEGFTLAG
jgi:hypothetical protein